MREQADRFRERIIGIGSAQQRRARTFAGDISRNDDSRCICLEKMLVIFRIGDEREIARLCVLDAGDAANLDVAVAFQPAFQPFS